MKVHVIGIGKCGSRICYDIFAYNLGLPGSTAFRLNHPGGFVKALPKSIKNMVVQTERTMRSSVTWIKTSFGETKFFDDVSYVVIDSDAENNEVTQWIELVRQDKAAMGFPGRVYQLASHEGGCDYHVLSETIAFNWKDSENSPLEAVSPGSGEIVVYCYSVGGGTGGGAGPILAHSTREMSLNPTARPHVMGLSVLPHTEIDYGTLKGAGALVPASMSQFEFLSLGRFFAGYYGERQRQKPGLHSLFLVGNDSLRIASDTHGSRMSSAQPVDIGYDALNSYVARVLRCIANQSSSASKSSSDFDATEITNRLENRGFVVGFSEQEAEVGERQSLNTVRKLVTHALGNPRITYDGSTMCLEGLSVPEKFSELAFLTAFENRGPIDSVDALIKPIEAVAWKSRPLGFRTASDVIVIHTQGAKARSKYKHDVLRSVISEIFRSAMKDFHDVEVPGSIDSLVVVMVDPFVRAVQSGMFAYIRELWWAGAPESCNEILTRIVTHPNGDDELNTLSKYLSSEEQYRNNERIRISDDVLSYIEGNRRPPFNKFSIIGAMTRLRRCYQRGVVEHKITVID